MYHRRIGLVSLFLHNCVPYRTKLSEIRGQTRHHTCSELNVDDILYKTDDDGDIPMDESARKNSRFLMSRENLQSSTCSRPISPVQRCQTALVVPSMESKVRTLLTEVEICDFIDYEGNIVSVDDDFSRC